MMREPNWIANNHFEITWWYIRKITADDTMKDYIGEYAIVSRSGRWFYKFKAIVCLILNREPDFSSDKYAHIDGVTVAITNGGTSYSPGEPTIYWGEYVTVGYGWFTNWWHCVYQDSN